ncbi:glycoside hydrolase family 95-like protein [Streptomyces sp. Inha503]|uniref:glycoside hydrolase family 95-like protein n=1 Tax=Streptomyces sp. Inha503 TaxID=3383314 RepID=UPI0039A3004F
MDGLDVILLADEINNPIKGNALLNKNDQPINLEGVVPAWPEGRDAKFVRLRAKGAFTVSAERKAGGVRYVDVTSDKGNRFALATPWRGDRVTVVDDHGRRVAHTTRDGVVSFRTAPGRTYRLTR